jgi:hypothetical protein
MLVLKQVNELWFFALILHSVYYLNCGTVVKVLGYKSEGRWLDCRWCHWNFSLTLSFLSHYGSGVDSPSNRNEYQEYFLGIKAAGA